MLLERPAHGRLPECPVGAAQPERRPSRASAEKIGHTCRVRRSTSEILSDHFRRQHGLILSERTTSEILQVVRSTAPVEDELAFEVRGRAADGQTASVLVTRSEVRRAVRQGDA